jgi:hypothetical protein
MKYYHIAFTCLTLVIAACSSDSSSGSSNGGGGGVVSCDVVQAGLHYCEEAPGTNAASAGCPANTVGFTPGTGCSRDGLTGTCASGPYTFYIYGSATAGSTLAGICQGGTFTPVDAGAS